MRHRGKITLFVPESSDEGEYLWRRYVISHVSVHMRRDGGTFSGEIYIFDGDAAVYSGLMRCAMPSVFPGCAVLDSADMSDRASLVPLPDGCFKVLSAERFDGGCASHVKLLIG